MKSLKQLVTPLFYSLLLIVLTACQAAAAPPASSTPMLTVREATNCRTGPGTNYDIVFTYPAGAKLPIVGRHEPGDFWLVKSDKSTAGSCWMWGGSVDVTGNYQAVAGATPLPAPTGAAGGTAPDAPSLQQWDYACENETLTFTVTWKDRASGETGYRIFRDGQLLAELSPDSTAYTDSLPAKPDVEYYIQVYGPDGSANSSVMKAGC